MKAITLLLIILWICMTLQNVNCAKNTNKVLRELKKASKNHTKVLVWDTYKYTKYVKASPRTFGIAMLITAEDAQYQCTACIAAGKTFRNVANAYAQGLKLYKDSIPLFFVVLDVDNAREIFGENKLETVPFVTYFEPLTNVKSRKLPSLKSVNEDLDFLLEYLNKNHEISIPKPLNQYGGFITAFVVAFTVAFIWSLLPDSFDKLLDCIRSKYIWMTISLLIYLYSIGGMTYCLLTKPQSFMYQSSKQFMFVHPQGRNQFIYEGVLISLLYFACMASVILAYRVVTKLSKQEQNPSFFRRIFSSIQISLFLATFFYFFNLFLSLYTKKNKWYNIWEIMPESLKTFMTSIQRNAKSSKGIKGIIWKLCHLGYSWIYGYSSLPKFGKKLVKLFNL